jgi:hypothetical protein
MGVVTLDDVLFLDAASPSWSQVGGPPQVVM